jgi:predicted N-formylglutamate amidohydrolase
VEAHIAAAVRAHGHVTHVSVHTFTPVMKGKTRPLDIGLLFDPARANERDLCARWRRAIGAAHPALRTRFNLPYRGAADGFTTHLRSIHPEHRYTGVELEVNQALVGARAGALRLGAMLADTFPATGAG